MARSVVGLKRKNGVDSRCEQSVKFSYFQYQLRTFRASTSGGYIQCKSLLGLKLSASLKVKGSTPELAQK